MAQIYRFFTFSKSWQVLTDAFGSCPAGTISVLGKLGPYARPKHVYMALHKVLAAAGPLANHVCQAAEFRDYDIISLASASMTPVSNRVFRALLKCGCHEEPAAVKSLQSFGDSLSSRPLSDRVAIDDRS